MIVFLFFYNIFFMVAFAFCTIMCGVLFNKSKRKILGYSGILFCLCTIDNLIYFMNEFLPSFAAFYRSIYPANILTLSVLEVLLFMYLSEIVLSSFNDCAAIRDLSAKDKTIRISIRILWGIMVILNFITPLAMVFSAALMVISLLITIYNYKKSFFPLWLLVSATVLFVSEMIPGFMPLYDYSNGGFSQQLSFTILQRGINVELISIMIVATGIYAIHKYMKGLPGSGNAMKISHRKFDHICMSYNLTAREIEIAKLVCRGFNNNEISEQLFISVGTVKTHIHHIFEKFEVNSRIQLLARIMNIELVEEDKEK